MTNAVIFIDEYKQLEEVVRSAYHLRESDSISFYLSGQAKYQKFKNEIKYCQDLRNLLNHKKKLKNNFAVEPNQSTLDFIDVLIEQIKNRAKCDDIKINISKVFWQSLDGNVKNAMKKMQENLYTHIPILENGIVRVVFDENSVFNYLAEEEIVDIDEDLNFQKIEKYISLKNREMEEFIFLKVVTMLKSLRMKLTSILNRERELE